MWESHLDQTYLGEAPASMDSSAALATADQLPANSSEGPAMPGQQLPVFLGLTRMQVILVVAIAFAVYWWGIHERPPRRRKSRRSR